MNNRKSVSLSILGAFCRKLQLEFFEFSKIFNLGGVFKLIFTGSKFGLAQVSIRAISVSTKKFRNAVFAFLPNKKSEKTGNVSTVAVSRMRATTFWCLIILWTFKLSVGLPFYLTSYLLYSSRDMGQKSLGPPILSTFCWLRDWSYTSIMSALKFSVS